MSTSRPEAPENPGDYVVANHRRTPEGHLVLAWPVAGGPARWYLDLSDPEIGALNGEHELTVLARLDVALRNDGDDLPDDVAGIVELTGPPQRRIVAADGVTRKKDVLQIRVTGEPPAQLGRADLGLQGEPEDVLDRLDKTLFGLVRGEARSRALLLVPDLRAWLAEGADRKRAREDQAARSRDLRNEKVNADTTFINPYTFVPLPPVVRRRRPEGHEKLRQGRVSGSVTVDWTLLSPLLLPQGAPPLAAEPLVVGGSAVKGMVRSLHETLFDGCLRVFDPDYVPVHRDTRVDHSAWKLAMIRCDEGVGRVEVCAREPIWVAEHLLRAARPESRRLSSGDLVRISRDDQGSGQRTKNARREVMDSGRVDPVGSALPGDDTWFVHLTDTAARDANKPMLFPVGPLPGDLCDVSDEAMRTYRKLCRSSADQTGNERPPGRRAPVYWPADAKNPAGLVGHRVTTDGELQEGDTVWVRRDEPDVVVEIRPSLLWRHHGSTAAGERLGNPTDPRQALLPCTDPDDLCPSCALFGSTDDTGDPDSAPAGDRARGRRVRAYAAHVRFGPATSSTPVSSKGVLLPPMGSPRPSSGNFYLRLPQRDPDRGRKEESRAGATSPGPHQVPEVPRPAGDRKAVPLADWGSALDHGSPRRLAGRKYYWHGYTASTPFPRHECRARESAQAREGGMDRQGHVVDAEQAVVPVVLTGEIRFHNLTEEQLGQLLAALEPGLVLDQVDSGQSHDDGRPALDERTFCVHLGGGKGLGYGTVQPRIRQGSLRLESALSRYAGGPVPTLEVASLVRDVVPDPVTETWRALASALTVGRVDPERIWYPPALPWSARVVGGTFAPDFDASYEFFGRARGGSLTEEDQTMVALRPATDASQAMPILGKVDKGTRNVPTRAGGRDGRKGSRR